MNTARKCLSALVVGGLVSYVIFAIIPDHRELARLRALISRPGIFAVVDSDSGLAVACSALRSSGGTIFLRNGIYGDLKVPNRTTVIGAGIGKTMVGKIGFQAPDSSVRDVTFKNIQYGYQR